MADAKSGAPQKPDPPIAPILDPPPVSRLPRVPTTSSEWTVTTLKEYLEAVSHAEDRFGHERDRRYAEVNVEKEKALKIKETADLAALQLAREIQTYKDEKANELREQIASERGHYASKEDVASVVDKFETILKPIAEFVSLQQGRQRGIGSFGGALLGVLGLLVAVLVPLMIYTLTN